MKDQSLKIYHIDADAVPLPEREERKNIQAEINAELFEVVAKTAKEMKLTRGEIIEYGLLVWLTKVNPKEARRLMKEMGLEP